MGRDADIELSVAGGGVGGGDVRAWGKATARGNFRKLDYKTSEAAQDCCV